MKKSKLNLYFTLVIGILLTVPAFPQDSRSDSSNTEMRTRQIASGVKQKLNGVIIKRDPDSFVMRDETGNDVMVTLTNLTKVEERKSNPFRSAKKYPETYLLRGLNVQVEGRGNGSSLVAEKIKFSDNDYRVAVAIDSRVLPVERNTDKLSGQVDELAEVANTARGGAKAAQESADAAQRTADQAMSGVNAANERISMLDDYDVRQDATVNFRVGSAVLSPEAKMALDDIANQAKNEKGYVIEVRGFASSDGNENYNRQLSQRRADAVVRYLAENHAIPLRRVITPFGFGELQPVAENTTREGRVQNRRVEVRILVSKGLKGSATSTSSTETQQSKANGTAKNNQE